MIKSAFNILAISISSYLFISLDTPKGWFLAGSKPKSYEMGLDVGAGQEGSNAATMKSIDKKIDGFGTIMQQIQPEKFRGKRIRLKGIIKTNDVKDWAGIWMRVDQESSKNALAFDNMSNRPIKGTTNWSTYEVVLDVPYNAHLIAYGVLLNGNGQIWVDKLTFEVVSENIPTTGYIKPKNIATLAEPMNLDFEN